jgi:hypothetical protein
LPADQSIDAILLFAESNSRFLCEVPPARSRDFEKQLGGLCCACIGNVTQAGKLEIVADGRLLVSADIASLKAAWQAPLDWP